MSFVLASVFAAIAAVTVTSKVDVPIQRVYVPIVVFGAGASGLGSDILARPGEDVTEAQIEALKARLVTAGIAAASIQSWMQQTKPQAPVLGVVQPASRIGIVVVDAGAPAQARTTLALLANLGQPALQFGWNTFLAVDCTRMTRDVQATLDTDVKNAAVQFARENRVRATIRSVTPLSRDPQFLTLAPIVLCPKDVRPLVNSAADRVLTPIDDVLRVSSSASVEIAYDLTVPNVEAPASATSIFPFNESGELVNTFGFLTPVGDQKSQAYTLRGGRYAAVPGTSEVAIPADAALFAYTFRNRENYDAALRGVRATGLQSEDYQANDDALHLFVRLRRSTMQLWSKLAELRENSNANSYRFVGDCAPMRAYAHAVALERSRRLAAAGAAALNVPLGPLVAQTNWPGAQTDAVCGKDGSTDIATLIASVQGRERSVILEDPTYAYFWESTYAAWTLGAHPPSIAARAIVGRFDPVIRSSEASTQVTGTATIAPDAGNVVTDCDAAQQRSLANAVKVALMDGQVGSFYAAPAFFWNIACLDKALVGHSSASNVNTYDASSATGAAQVMTTITVYP